MEYDPVELVTILPHKERNHITIKNEKECKECAARVCSVICPTAVYYYKDKLDIKYWQCLECGACEIACSNIEWKFPMPPYGVSYKKN